MSYTNLRLERAMRARDERLTNVWLKNNSPPTCPAPGCDRPLPTVLPGTVKGRSRVFCSDACRQRAYRARKRSGTPAQDEGLQAAPRPAVSPEPHGAPTPRSHAIGDCIIAVLESPYAIAEVLDAVRRAHSEGVLGRPEYADVRSLVESLAKR